MAELERRATPLREQLTSLLGRGFATDNDFDLGAGLGREYVESSVVHRTFLAEDLPSSGLTEAVTAVLAEYASLLVSGSLDNVAAPPAPLPDRLALMVYVGNAAETNFETGGRQGWWGWKDPPTGIDGLRVGDLIAFGRRFSDGSPRVDLDRWQRHLVEEVVVGRIAATPERTDRLVMPDEIAGQAAYPWKIRFEHLGAENNVALTPSVFLSAEASDALRRSGVSRGVGIPVPVAGSPLLERFVDSPMSPAARTPEAVAELAAGFGSAVAESGVRLPAEDVAAFVAALLTKPLAVLTGQSGSGKTQLAKRLGEWCGSDSSGRPRYLPIPVRPDWTGPEFLFGYQDALRSRAGKDVWFVPDALEFMMRAIDEPTAPYLLLLDEMNLAHVERYFADFLSGVESRDTVLPELARVDDEWIATGNTQRLPIPRNLFVVGTVNVDETTYLFSPKVLDRAFTFEFRTASSELDPTLRRPTAIAAGPPAHHETFVGVATDDDWQHDHPHAEQEAFAVDLRALHDVLSESGHDFGHRVFYESLRYAAMLGAIGIDERWSVIDRVVLTKLLPKVHGTRTRVEKPLRRLREFAQGEDQAATPRLPLTARTRPHDRRPDRSAVRELHRIGSCARRADSRPFWRRMRDVPRRPTSGGTRTPRA